MENTQVLDNKPGKDFIRKIIDEDILALRNGGKVTTRFPSRT